MYLGTITPPRRPRPSSALPIGSVYTSGWRLSLPAHHPSRSIVPRTVPCPAAWPVAFTTCTIPMSSPASRQSQPPALRVNTQSTYHLRPQWHTSQIGTALCRQRMRAANPSLAPPQQHIHCSRQLSEASQDPGWAGNSSRSGVVADLPSRKRVRLSPSRDRYTSRPSTKRLQGAHQTHDSGGTSS